MFQHGATINMNKVSDPPLEKKDKKGFIQSDMELQATITSDQDRTMLPFKKSKYRT